MYATSTIAASALIRDGPGALWAVLLTAGTDAAGVTVYDNTAGSGTVLAVLKATAGATAQWTPAVGQACARGLYAVVTGTAPSVTLVYA